MPIKAIKGMNDILPEEAVLWQWVESEMHRIFGLFHYREIRTPVVESLEVFARSLGSSTSIVEKEMYSFEDRQGKKIVLRPEGTASVMRAYIENHYDQQDPLARLYYHGPMYRYERPQKGRYRQFHQIGVEVIGSEAPMVDAELIHMADYFFKSLGIDDLELEINSLGCMVCRPEFTDTLIAYLTEYKSDLCEDCLRRLVKNPLRILDCKQEKCQSVSSEAPSIQEFLCQNCEEHFDNVLEGIGRFGSSYAVNTGIVRGLDYYQRTAFEFTTQHLGAQNAVAGGGRYDGLVRLMGGPHMPGVGFAIGVERLVELLKEKSLARAGQGPLVFMAAIGTAAGNKAVKLVSELRKQGVRVEMSYDGKGLKSLMKRSDRIGAHYTLILGSDELDKGVLAIRNMQGQSQVELPLDDISSVVTHIQGG